MVAIYVKVTSLRRHEGGQKVMKCSANAYGIAMSAGLSWIEVGDITATESTMVGVSCMVIFGLRNEEGGDIKIFIIIISSSSSIIVISLVTGLFFLAILLNQQ
jgi:hypothetical protein